MDPVSELVMRRLVSGPGPIPAVLQRRVLDWAAHTGSRHAVDVLRLLAGRDDLVDDVDRSLITHTQVPVAVAAITRPSRAPADVESLLEGRVRGGVLVAAAGVEGLAAGTYRKLARHEQAKVAFALLSNPSVTDEVTLWAAASCAANGRWPGEDWSNIERMVTAVSERLGPRPWLYDVMAGATRNERLAVVLAAKLAPLDDPAAVANLVRVTAQSYVHAVADAYFDGDKGPDWSLQALQRLALNDHADLMEIARACAAVPPVGRAGRSLGADTLQRAARLGAYCTDPGPAGRWRAAAAATDTDELVALAESAAGDGRLIRALLTNPALPASLVPVVVADRERVAPDVLGDAIRVHRDDVAFCAAVLAVGAHIVDESVLELCADPDACLLAAVRRADRYARHGNRLARWVRATPQVVAQLSGQVAGRTDYGPDNDPHGVLHATVIAVLDDAAGDDEVWPILVRVMDDAPYQPLIAAVATAYLLAGRPVPERLRSWLPDSPA